MGSEVYIVGDSKNFGAVVKKSGLIDTDKLYKELRSWFDEHKYVFTEKESSEKILTDGKHMMWIWAASKKVDEYVKFCIEVEMRLSGCREVTVETKGKKMKKQKGDILMRFKGYLVKDYQDRYKGRLGKFIKSVYERYIIKDKLDNYAGKIWMETNDLIKEAKKILASVVV